MIHPDNEKILFRLFDVAKLYVVSAGGDGDAWFIGPKFRELANLFERYEVANKGAFIHRREMDLEAGSNIAFWSGYAQESICFIPDRSLLPNWVGDLVVESIQWL